MSGIVTKAVAEVVPGEDDAESPNGTFEVILSAQTEDRDGDTLKQEDWQTPLPDHITFDTDHGMSVSTTVGSGRPEFDADGNIRVRGSFSSIPRAQEVRTLVKEGHVNRTSVAFMTSRASKAAGGKVTRELLNGAFVAVPSNREAVVLSSKALEVVEEKAGARNSAADLEQLQAAHDALTALGAVCAAGGKSVHTHEAAAPSADADSEEQKPPAAAEDAAPASAAADAAAEADADSAELELRALRLRAHALGA